jgi:phosphoglucosamine mutase
LVGDGMFTTLYLLEALQTNNKSLSQMNKGFTQFPQILVNVKVRKKVPFENDAEISNAAKRIEQELGEKGRLLLRYSGTEYLARIMIEGECQAEIEKQANQIAKIIETRLG